MLIDLKEAHCCCTYVTCYVSLALLKMDSQWQSWLHLIKVVTV